MPTELTTRGQYASLYADRESPLKGMKSVQVATVQHTDMSFGDIIDMVNPLHHIPIVSSFYSDATGDTISPVAKMVGGGLLGGVFGLVTSAINVIFEEATGESLIGNVANAILGDETQAATSTALAAAAPKDTSKFYHVTPTSAKVELPPTLDMEI